MKESLNNLMAQLIALPGKLIDVATSALANPKDAVKYVALVVVLLDIYTGGGLVDSLLGIVGKTLGLATENATGLVVAVLAWVAVKK